MIQMGIIEGESRKIAQAICDAFQPFVHERIEEAYSQETFRVTPMKLLGLSQFFSAEKAKA